MNSTPEAAGGGEIALAQIGYYPDDVGLVVATHHHADHVGGALFFTRACQRISETDWPNLPPEYQHFFLPVQLGEQVIGDFELRCLGWHTPGSIAVFHRPTRVLFCGDHNGGASNMRLVVHKWGNSLALRLPKAVARDLNLHSGSSVELQSNGEEIIIKRAPTRHSLDDLVSRITESNRHAEITVTPVKGKEAW
ncbi:MAG: AbrB/MazE/SpoVT family DNA-binding domain-containing protein [Bacillota bacterium]|nr:AbrB/MazE/SpoVT family DNA-binding domain-containing protein [Bacillota bacterium]